MPVNEYMLSAASAKDLLNFCIKTTGIKGLLLERERIFSGIPAIIPSYKPDSPTSVNMILQDAASQVFEVIDTYQLDEYRVKYHTHARQVAALLQVVSHYLRVTSHLFPARNDTAGLIVNGRYIKQRYDLFERNPSELSVVELSNYIDELDVILSGNAERFSPKPRAVITAIGDSYTHKEALKNYGFKWNGTKKSWEKLVYRAENKDSDFEHVTNNLILPGVSYELSEVS